MFNVVFVENKNVLLCQLLSHVPSEGEDIRIKGRKGKVSSINRVDENKIYVQVALETVNKNKNIVDNSKKKRK